MSKILDLPKVLKYPRLYPFDKLEEAIKNIFCYIIRHYGNNGLSVLIYRQLKSDQVVVLCGDWLGNNIDLVQDSDLSKMANKFIQDHVVNYIATMRLIKIEQAQFFFAIVDDELVLVDIQTSLNKLSGPGMVRDIFGKIIKTQEVCKIEILDERSMQGIKDGIGSYSGNLIIKPTRFRMYHEADKNIYNPMYVEVLR
jgi:hypothetical protein